MKTQAEESHAYKEWMAGVFDRSSASYDRVGPRFFSYFGRGLVEFAAIRAGSRVLDVACGRGAVLMPASEQVGAGGEVVGIDLSPGMVTRLEEELQGSGVTNATAIVMDAEDLQFGDSSFDYVLCGLSLFFFPNLEAALGQCFRVLVPGGTLVASTVVHIEQPWEDRVREVSNSYRHNLDPAPTVATKDLALEGEVTAELEGAGFTGIEHEMDSHRSYYRDEAEWWEAQWSMFGRGFLERLDAGSLDAYKRRVMDLVRAWRTERGLPITVSVRYTRAQKTAAKVQAW